MRNRGSLNLPPDEHTFVTAWRDAQKALRTEENPATENIRTLRRGNGLSPSGCIHVRWTDTEPQIFRHQWREPKESIGLPVVLGILVIGWVLGLCSALLAGWRPW